MRFIKVLGLKCNFEKSWDLRNTLHYKRTELEIKIIKMLLRVKLRILESRGLNRKILLINEKKRIIALKKEKMRFCEISG